MAMMIPEKPRNFDPSSQEGLIFDALAQLPEDYYVFHSFRITDTRKGVFRESETDFVILNRSKGVICLEAKAGQIRYENGCWLYGSGIPMHNGGPFNQASANKYKLMRYISDSSMAFILEKCKFFHAVWFPSVSDDRLRSMSLPSEGDKILVLTKEALTDPKEFIDRVYALELPSRVKTDLSEVECKRLVRKIFCPQFNVFPSVSFEADLKKIVFHRLLDEQAGILDFLAEQLTAAVNGAAGTGKTMIAVEKARRHAASGEKVLFLCFNAQLKNYLEENYTRELVSYYTIAGFACKICNTVKPDYNELKSKLEDYYISGSFPYKHVVIDEGQDFGSEAIEETDIIQLIYDIIVDSDQGGTFYVFYDRLQLIQAKEMPKFIGDLDCRLTLYRNCRNTENIAVTSLRPITERKPKVFDGAVKGAPAKLHFCESVQSERERIDAIIDELAADGYRDIVLLTCKTETTSILSGVAKDGKYRNKYLFTTCRKFKGLEADVVILLDVDKTTFEQDNVLLFYVGTSRARIKLEIVAVLSDDDCKDILSSVLNYQGKVRRAKKDLAGALNAVGSLNT
ncbi:nuclease-related domain-containing DEAD/DEAH box helicase [Stomatobaculum longum]|uniref:nuclease-related domain-containing DEAD/DEAH box helicase n=1 Tax=Stomatobaculum longum TaxID=796942 RepID=UPI0028803385|nr:ATP-binding domain-containing protein [Stomatobaculum longum]